MTMQTEEHYRAPRAGYQGSGHIIYEPIRVFSFSQRLNRLRYACYSFTSALVMLLIAILISIGAMALGVGAQATAVSTTLLTIAVLAVSVVWLIYAVSLVVRRLHDMGKSGWMMVLFLSPLLTIPLMLFNPNATTTALVLNITSPLFSLYLLVGAGDGMNRYGTPNEPNSVLVNLFGGLCWVLSVAVLLIQVAFMTAQYSAPEKLNDVMRKLPLDQRMLERTYQQYR